MSGPYFIEVEFNGDLRHIETKDEKSLEVKMLKETFLECEKFVSLSYINKDGKQKK